MHVCSANSSRTVKMLCTFMLLFFYTIEGHHLQNDLPEFITPCKTNVDLSKCSRRILEGLRSHLVKGIPKFRLPPIDPLDAPQITAERRNSKIAEYRADLSKVQWIGVKDYEIVDVFLDLQELIFRLKLVFPKLLLHTEGKVVGTMLGFKIDGVGGALVNFTNVIFDIVLNGRLYEHKAEEFIEWSVEDVGIIYDDAYYIDLYGLFEDQTLNHLFKLALNKGARLISSTFRTLLSSIPDFILQATNRVHKLFPKNVLYSS